MVSNTEVTHGYCTVDDLREQLGDLTSQNLSERQLVRAINAASRAVDNWCDRRFWQDAAPTTRLVNVGPDNYLLTLPGLSEGDAEISTTTGLAIATDTAGDGTYAGVWSAADYRLAPYGANIGGSIYGAWWTVESAGNQFAISAARGYRPVQITARFGWAFVPDAIEQATILKAAQLFKRKDAPFGVVQFGDIAAVTITRKDADVIELLWPYQRDVAMVG